MALGVNAVALYYSALLLLTNMLHIPPKLHSEQKHGIRGRKNFSLLIPDS